MDFAIWTGGPEPDKIIRGEPYTDPTGTQHPRNIWRLWPPDELAAINAYPLVRSAPTPGHRIIDRRYALVGGQVVETIVTSRPKRLDMTAADLIALRLAEVDDMVEARLRETMTHEGRPFWVDDRTALIAEALYAKLALDDPVAYPWDPAYTWLAADNTYVPLSAAGVLALAVALRAHVRGIILAGRAHRDALTKLLTVADIHAYDAAAGWP